MKGGFASLGLQPPLLEAVGRAGYTEPTPIQREAIPVLLEGRDLIGIAHTGTGKTLAFLLPILHGLREVGPDPQALVLCPTRELALQVGGEAQRLGEPLGWRTALVYGGTASGEQKQALGRGCEIVVGTPGRVLDLLQSAWLSLKRLRYLVLDEADRMLDMGFLQDVDAILRRAPMSRQTMLFSATMPEEVRKLARRYMIEPRIVRVEGAGREVKATIEHYAIPVAAGRKTALLDALLRHERPHKALVFTATREATSVLARELRRRGHEVASLSSLLSQSNRERVLEAFRKGEFRVLVATNVAARGLDITDIDLVVNYDVPSPPEDYVHRIGRTARAERSGRAVTLVSPGDRVRVERIERLLGYRIPRREIEGFEPPAGGRKPRARSAAARRRRRGRR